MDLKPILLVCLENANGEAVPIAKVTDPEMIMRTVEAINEARRIKTAEIAHQAEMARAQELVTQ